MGIAVSKVEEEVWQVYIAAFHTYSVLGKIFTYWVGELPIVSVNDYELAHQLFVKEADAFADRCAPEHFLRYTREGHVSGVIFTSGHLWQDQRRFALRVLKDFGLGKNDMQEKAR